MIAKKCKICRRLGGKIFIKGDRCSLVKCAAVRKHPLQKKRPRKVSEYGLQLKEKQKLKLLYGLREKQFKNYVMEAIKKRGDATSFLIKSLESRLDNAVYRLGFAPSRNSARQMVSHGHISVNNKKATIPSFRIRAGDKISIKERSKNKQIFKNLDITLKGFQPPEWLKLDKIKKEGEIMSLPSDQKDYQINASAIVEFYLK